MNRIKVWGAGFCVLFGLSTNLSAQVNKTIQSNPKAVTTPVKETQKVTKGVAQPIKQTTAPATTVTSAPKEAVLDTEGGQANPCQTPPAGSLYGCTAQPWLGSGAPMSMCEYKGDVLLIVNVAAACGYTPQMAGLQVLEESLGAQGLRVLAFLSDDFGNQGGTNDQVTQCTAQYNAKFAMFAKEHVIDPDGGDGPAVPQPVWKWLLSQPNPGPAGSIQPTWNFHKYLIARDGRLVAHWPSNVYPGDDPNNPNDSFDTNEIVQRIRAELAR